VLRGLAILCLLVRTAQADPITDRDFAIDFYDGVAIGDARQVGMGGTGLALIPGSAGTLLNASAPAVRQTTDTETWSWDYHLDYLTGKLSSDYDNNGIVVTDPATGKAEDSGAQLLTGGLGLRVRDWAGVLTVTAQSTPLGTTGLEAEALRTRLAIAKFFHRIDTAIGIGFQTIAFRVGPRDQPELFSITGGGLLVGATWTPRLQNFRVAAEIESRIIGGRVETEACDPDNCMGYILPNQVESSARLGIGAAYRWSPTRWNQLVGGTFRDERSVTVATDLWITDRSKNGHGIEAFGAHELQRSGRHVGFALRVGAEVEWLPGRLRVRAGSYWEPERFDGISGRIHGTLGADVRVFEFELWGRRRGRIGGTLDVASRYRNIAVSVGFWH
jgi:hypothetical protein